MTLEIDRGLYSVSCISKSVYSLADKYSILRRLKGETEILDVTPINSIECCEDVVKAAVIDTLNDFKLREIINEETKDIRTILYAKAFSDYDDPVS